ncbi:MAG: hypothetical protein M1812_004339 [Candelaria pacifica]|nr:MAG: hypothetical protein M1812_004339 [Candelaria pacifica]
MSFQENFLDKSTYQHRGYTYDDQQSHSFISTLLAYTTISLLLVYYLVTNLGFSPSSMLEPIWEVLVHITPYRLIKPIQSSNAENVGIGSDEPGNEDIMQRHAAKSEALKRFLGLDGGSLLRSFHHTTESVGLKVTQTKGPPGLGNWDNSCYQNSVIQALASLPSLSEYLRASNVGYRSDKSRAGAMALSAITRALNDPSNSGKRLWTPDQLKSMSSWQQQDAQEYLSKIFEDIARQTLFQQDPGLTGTPKQNAPEDERTQKDCVDQKAQTELHRVESPVEPLMRTQACPLKEGIKDMLGPTMQNLPMEGLLAQRVGCMRCQYTEGLSLIPFNCLTVPLGNNWLYDIRECLDAYTTLESIEGVECGKCTLLKSKEQLENLLRGQSRKSAEPNSIDPSQRSQGLHALTSKRLEAVNTSLEDEDFTDRTLLNACRISPKNRVTTTKSRQAVIARTPRTLVIHINRSVFDERTGLQRKNQANVQFPEFLDLDAWCLGSNPCSPSEPEEMEEWSLEPGRSMLANKETTQSGGACNYGLRAVITHYGRHENGHYTCYRKYPSVSSPDDEAGPDKNAKENWWRISDANVEMVTEEEVLAQGDVFMLFYERTQEKTSTLSNCPSAKVPEGANLQNLIDSAAPTGETESYSPKESSKDRNLALVDDEGPSVALADETTETLNENASMNGDPARETASVKFCHTAGSQIEAIDHPSGQPHINDTSDDTSTEREMVDNHRPTTPKLTDTSNHVEPIQSLTEPPDKSMTLQNEASQAKTLISDENMQQSNGLMAH